MDKMNQNPEQKARDEIDQQLRACGWDVQSRSKINLHTQLGVAVREYPTEVGPVDYALFVRGKPVGVIEAKREEEGEKLSVHEGQAEGYAEATLKYLRNEKLSFVYLSTGQITYFSDNRDPKPRFREVFSFHRPETLLDWADQKVSLRGELQNLTAFDWDSMRDCQVEAIRNLEISFKQNKPKALIQMATGAGKTFMAITSIYRLLKFTHARRILFLVDTRNLGEQAEQEFMAYLPQDDNRRFTELYGVHRLKSRFIPDDNQVYISTIQRLYAILRGQELDESEEEASPYEKNWKPKEPLPVVYNEKLPLEFFDVIVIDECHRSIYNLWKQVLDYFDAFQVGLTATPDNRTIGYFNQNLVSEYSHDQAVADNVNVSYEVYLIETQVTQNGGTLWRGANVELRDRLTRKKRYELQDEDEDYVASQLDKEIVNPNQIRTVIEVFKEKLQSELFPDRIDESGAYQVPKTLIFAKTDSHADDIIRITREVFDEGNDFCKKITYRTDGDPKSVLADFRNEYHPRIAVTVDMIATGTNVLPLEILIFMRGVKSRNYFEQMKGRGTRVMSFDDLKKVSSAARFTKDHFVVVDAIGVSKSLKTVSRPLEKKPGVTLKALLEAAASGALGEDLFTSLANRLARLNRHMDDTQRSEFQGLSGKPINRVAQDLLDAYDPDILEDIRVKAENELPYSTSQEREEHVAKRQEEWQRPAVQVFTGELNGFIEKLGKILEQKVDDGTPDRVIFAGTPEEQRKKAEAFISEFKVWIEENKDELTALQIFYAQPYRRRELSERMVKELLERLKSDKPVMAPYAIWRAYEHVEKVEGRPKNELVALVALLRHIVGTDSVLTAYDRIIDRNFQLWAFDKHKGNAPKFSVEQMQWLTLLKEQIATSVHVETGDLEYTPFDAMGGKGKMWQLFGEQMEPILSELNEVLTA